MTLSCGRGFDNNATIGRSFDATISPILDVLLRGLSMVCSDEAVLAFSAPLFVGLYEYRSRALLLGRDPS
jgi:hypothetical protein